MIDPAKLDMIREMMDDYAVEAACPCCGRENVGKFFVRTRVGSRWLDCDTELMRAYTRYYRCEACDGKFHVSTVVPERELFEDDHGAVASSLA